jgi:hypothetical protein
VKEDKGLRKELLVVAFDNEREKTLQKGWVVMQISFERIQGWMLRTETLPLC